MASRLDAEVTLLRIHEPNLPPRVMKEIRQQMLSEAGGQFEGVKLDQKLESGDPAKTIVQAAKEGNYDLILVGHKGHNTVSRFLMGSVSDHVIHYADRSVLLIG